MSAVNQRYSRRPIFLGTLLVIFSVGVLLSLLIPTLGRLSEAPLLEGDVAPYDILAPSAITYASDILTERARDSAESAVAPVYSPADISIARRQMERLRGVLAYITSVRADSYATYEQKQSDLAALEDILLSQDSVVHILALNDSRWQNVQQEAIVVLEQVMRGTIREERLEDARRGVPTLVSLSLPEDQARIVAELVSAFVAPNSIYNEELTEVARQQARESVDTVTRSFIPGENIVQRGQIIRETDLEALQAFGMAQPQGRWQDLVSTIALTLLTSAIFTLYLRYSKNKMKAGELDLRGLTLLTVLFLVILLIARMTIPGHAVIPYVFPVMAYGLTTSALFGSEIAIISSLPFAMLVAYGLPNALDLTLYYILSSILGVLALRDARRFVSFFWAGAAIAISGAVIATAYRVVEPTADWVGLATLAGAAVVNGVASATLSLLLQLFLAQLLGMTTPLQLIELSRPDHPLLQFILRNAPGTYQHSLQLANLVEHAADQIDADTILTRVGALYHDAGKGLNPFYFIENQPTGSPNPHNDLDPLDSAVVIRQHVLDGLELARKYRLPPRVQAFIAEHHGTMITRYQYAKAIEAAGGDESQVDIEQFRYPGPRPQSRETALLMLADGCEARMRAERPKDEAELRALIKDVIEVRLELGQLDDTGLTLKDLTIIADSFATSLRGVYHPRIAYPKIDKKSVPEVHPDQPPEAESADPQQETSAPLQQDQNEELNT